MRGNAFINQDSLRNLERLILILGSIVLISGTLLLLSAGLTRFKDNEARSKNELTRQEIRGLNETIEKSKRIKFTSKQKQELNIVQASMDRLALENHCQLQEVNSTNDTVPLTTRYKKGIEDKGWKQLAMTGQVVGSLSNVMSFTRALSMISVPIELAAIDLSPVGGERDSKVIAKITFQILKQEAPR
jgi:hypothetical protein